MIAGLGEAAGLSQVLPGQVELDVDGNIFTGLGGSRDRSHRHDVVISSIQCVHSLLDLHVVKILSLSLVILDSTGPGGCHILMAQSVVSFDSDMPKEDKIILRFDI